MLLSIIIPFLNEQETIGEVLQQVTSTVIEGYNFEIILVNDGSDDQSVNIIQDFIAQYTGDYKIQLINFAKNSGKGFALKAGIAKCEGDLILIQDADMEYTPRDYAPLISHLNKNKLDFVYGSRTLGIKKFANHYSNKVFLFGGLLVSIVTSVLTFTKMTDEPTCYKLFSQKTKDYLLLPPENGFEWEPAITMILLRKKFRYGEYPIHYFPRDVAHGKKINWKDGVKAIMTLIVWRFKKIQLGNK
ncbi:glycosyltransferase family 2 protein [Candidatus Gracilibacteria bacterium]|nr:glycosyltransferase family 2 protein [Candidatus Gracilibacteria bacterium]